MNNLRSEDVQYCQNRSLYFGLIDNCPRPVQADQLTLSQRGGQIMLCAPLDFSDLPTALNNVSCHGIQ